MAPRKARDASKAECVVEDIVSKVLKVIDDGDVGEHKELTKE